MRRATKRTGTIPFPFVLDELVSLRLCPKSVFGFTHVYLDEKLMFSFRDSAKQTATNGIWIYTTVSELDSLAREFPDLPRRQLWRSGRNGWVVLASRLAYFEDYAYKLCELISNGDRRVGRVTRASVKTSGKLTSNKQHLFQSSSPG